MKTTNKAPIKRRATEREPLITVNKDVSYYQAAVDHATKTLNLDEAQYKKYIKVFQVIDDDGSGKVSKSEFKKAIEKLHFGTNLGRDALDAMFDDIDEKKSGQVDIINFLNQVSKPNGNKNMALFIKAALSVRDKNLKKVDDEEFQQYWINREDQWKILGPAKYAKEMLEMDEYLYGKYSRAFHLMDEDEDEDEQQGRNISKVEFTAVLNKYSLGLNLSRTEVAEIFDDVDKREKGVINLMYLLESLSKNNMNKSLLGIVNQVTSKAEEIKKQIKLRPAKKKKTRPAEENSPEAKNEDDQVWKNFKDAYARSLEANPESVSESPETVIESAKLLFEDAKKAGPTKGQKMTTFRFLTSVMESSLQSQEQQADEIEELRKVVREMENQNDEFKRELEGQTKAREEELLQQIEELKRVIDEKEGLLQATDLTSKLDEYSNTILKLNHENEAFKHNEIKINEAKEALVAELGAKEALIAEFEATKNQEVSGLQDKVRYVEQELQDAVARFGQEKDQLSLENEDLLGRANTLEKTLEQTRSEKSLQQEELKGLQDLLDKQNVQLETDLQSRSGLESENQTLKDENDQLSAQVQSLEEKANGLEGTLSQVTSDKLLLEGELEDKLRYHDEALNKQKVQLQNSLAERGTLERENQILKQEKDRLSDETHVLLQKSGVLEESLNKLRGEKSLLEGELKNREALLNEQKALLESDLNDKGTLGLENITLKQERDQLLAETQNLQKRSSILEDNLANLQNEKSLLEQDLEGKLKNHQGLLAVQNGKIQGLELENQALKQEKNRLSVDAQNLLNNSGALGDNVNKLQNELNRTQRELESRVSNQEYERVCLENKVLAQQQEKLHGDLLVSRSNTKDSHTREEELTLQISHLKGEVSRARVQITNMVEKETYNGLLSERESLLGKSTMLEREVSTARSNENEILEKMKASQDNLKSSEEDLLHTKKQLQDMVAREEYTRIKLENEASEREIAGLRTDNSIANSRIRDLEASKAESDIQRDQLQQEIRSLLTKGQSAGDGTQMLISQNQNLQEKINTLEANHRKLESETSQSEVKISQLQTELHQAKQSTQDMVSKEEYQKLELDREELANKNNKLEREMGELKGSIQELKARRNSEEQRLTYPQEKSKLLGKSNLNLNNVTEKSLLNTTLVNENDAITQLYKHKIPRKTKIMIFVAIIRLLVEIGLAVYFGIRYDNMQDDEIHDKTTMKFCAICLTVGAVFDIVYLFIAIAIIRRLQNIIKLAGRNRLVSDGVYAHLLPKTLDEPVYNGNMYSSPKLNNESREDVQLTII